MKHHGIPIQSSFKILIFIVLTLACKMVSAQEPPTGQPESPYFFVVSSSPGLDVLPMKSTRAEVSIAGVIADVTITQEYRNDGSRPLEAIYMFPASTQAAVYAMEMVIGDRKIVAHIEEKQKARAQYETAKSEGKRTSLLEQQRPNIFQMNVANIMPGDVIKVTLRYTELLTPVDGTYKFVYPTVVGPRYSGESSANNAVASAPFHRQNELPDYTFDLSISVFAGVPIQHLASNTHKVNNTFTSASSATVNLSPEEKHGGNRDFILEYKLAGEAIESGLILYEHGDENFFLLMVQPPKRIIKEEIPPREYIFIVDVSGSMHGFPINTAKTLMRNLVVNLRPEDQFNVLLFESGAHWLADQSLAATTANVDKAASFLDQQQGGGGTNMLAAIRKAKEFPRAHDNLSRSYIIVTDGYVSVEKEVFDIIRSEANQANTFSFGIGSSANRYIIDGIAHVGMSEPSYILSPAHADEEAEKFRKYINYPVLTQISHSISGLDAYDIEPLSIPDVLADRPVILFGKYRGKATGNITIEGHTGTRKYKKTFKVSEAKASAKHSAIRYLWARKKIQILDDYAKLGSEQRDQVLELGMKYNLLTAYTSFIAVEENPVNSEKDLTTVKQPLPLPSGVEDGAVGFDLELDEEVTFSLHKMIALSANVDKVSRSKLEADITKQLVPAIHQVMQKSKGQLHEVEVTVGMDGNVVVSTVKGSNISEATKAEITKLIGKQLYGRYKVLLVWKYKIVF